MAMETRFEVKPTQAFAYGLYAFVATEVEAARDFEKSSAESFVQARDKDTGLPVWNFEVLDADPNAKGKNAAITVRILSEEKPTLPESPPGLPFRPVEFEGLTATPYVDSQRCTGERFGGGGHRCRARLAWSWRASGVVAPKPTSAARGPASRAAREEGAA